jgi:hypothetical protein
MLLIECRGYHEGIGQMLTGRWPLEAERLNLRGCIMR